jgi:rhodanese-related sulfurtransferase
MMKHKFPTLFLVVLLFIPFALVPAAVRSADIPRISIDELKAMLDHPDVVIVDVRTGSHWKSSEYKIKGAVREEPSDVESWASKYDKTKTIVLY